ncbi:MAG: CRISPR-associated helicase Cas3' [Chloroflexi bacterium]|nr:CRISPR-associated helicase Cas3' [Chloroflexota bacterium]
MNLFALWGKTSRDESGEVVLHPLLCHMTDVAEVTGALWHRTLGDGMRHFIADTLGCTLEEAGRTLMFWAALHDLGKASPAFQRRHAPAQAVLEREGLTLRHNSSTLPGWHGTVTTRTLRPLLEARAVPERLARDVARALGGHHGAWPTPIEVTHLDSDHLGDAPWAQCREELLSALAALYPPITIGGDHPLAHDRPLRQRLMVLLSGLVSVADWLGSMQAYFLPTPDPRTPEAYALLASERAHLALDQRWPAWQAADEPASFARLFPLTPRPHALQQAAHDLASRWSEPALAIVEAPTGTGKTEAALWLADTLLTQEGQRGLYVAMPTTATSNAMHARLSAMLEQRYGPGKATPLLIHGQALWQQPPPALRLEDDDPSDTGLDAMSWFLPRKRSLLAPFGVGTVDQALMAVLGTRHFFVRLFGLAHKTVVFDEVHAYDTYMNTLFVRLLRWLRAQGSNVILLSATLPQATRADLLSAWGTAGPLPSLSDEAYPAITWASGDQAGVVSVASPEHAYRVIHLERLPHDIPALVDALREELSEGGCAAVLCNTVGRAQQVYRELSAAGIVPEEDLLLFHGRFPAVWRAEIEAEVLARYSKEAPAERRRGIVVATQVIEQSLDLDLDLLVSELAPIDLLLQRAGRLHRHEGRRRPARLSVPRLLLQDPEEQDGVPAWGGTGYIYEPWLLLRTWLALEGCQCWNLPEDTRALIEAVYGESAPVPEAAQLQQALKEAHQQWEMHLREDAQKAMKPLVAAPESESLLTAANPMLAEDNPDAHRSIRARTRLGEEGITVVCLQQQGDRLTPVGHPACLIDPQAVPDDATARALVQASTGVSSQCLVPALLSQPAFAGWRQHPLLRSARALVFVDERCTLRTDKHTITFTLNRKEGLGWKIG